ncbi:MAG: hypothetical protein Q8K32_28240 [Archangium sp.]|nr:hypothetical protein [Archangium sp.]
MRRAWVFNLGAEDELARGGTHTPTASMIERVESLLPRLSALLRPGDEVIWPGSTTLDATFIGRAWCPTRWALTQMQRAGVSLPRAPGVDVLRRVNHRRFSHALGQSLPGAGYAENQAELSALLVPAGHDWLLKRALGYAGRGRKKLRAGEISAADQAWIDASLRSGDGLQVEPWVERQLDCALHGWLEEDGRCTWGRITVQEVDSYGAWQSSVIAPAGTLSDAEHALMLSEAERGARALHGAGYFGPFGIDAFRWCEPSGELQFQPRSEINARYSMGWAIGMAPHRPGGERENS